MSRFHFTNKTMRTEITSTEVCAPNKTYEHPMEELVEERMRMQRTE